jgi:hypothetical protein
MAWQFVLMEIQEATIMGLAYYGEQQSGGNAQNVPTGGFGAATRSILPTSYITAANNSTLSTTSITDIYNYASTTKNKSWVSSGGMTSISYQSSWSPLQAGFWNSTTALSSLTFSMDYGGSFY